MIKPRAISLGGYEEKIPRELREKIDFTHFEEVHSGIPQSACPDAEFIVVITKFSRRGSMAGRNAALNRGIPILLTMTWNYAAQEILNCQRLKHLHELFTKKDEPAAETRELAPVAAAESAISDKDLLAAYENMLIDAIKKVFLPGEKMDISEFLPLISEDVSLPEDQVRRLLPHMAITGLIDNPVGDTWRLIGSEGFTHDLEPAPKPKEEPESQAARILTLMKGLDPGPYPSKYAIETQLIEHQEFVTLSGNRFGRPQAYKYVNKAIEHRVIFEQGGEYYIVHDNSVKLTPVEPKVAPKKPELEKPKTPSLERVVDRVIEPIQARDVLQISDDVKFLKSVLGKISKPNIEWHIVQGIKSIMPMAHWDKLADNTVMKMLRKKSVSPRTIPKAMFHPDEWDSLAWDLIKEFTVGTMAPYFTVTYFDEQMFCFECKEPFTFTVGEKKFYYERELTSPKRCPACRQKKGSA